MTAARVEELRLQRDIKRGIHTPQFANLPGMHAHVHTEFAFSLWRG